MIAVLITLIYQCEMGIIPEKITDAFQESVRNTKQGIKPVFDVVLKRKDESAK